jgi:glycerol-3-phosphate O-acyltransferase
MTTANLNNSISIPANALNAIDCMSQKLLERMAELAQEALNGKRKPSTVLATLRNMAQELQGDINYMAEVAGCNYVGAR